jgi:large subunit ribosomal protein L10
VLTRTQKEELVVTLREKFGRATSIIVADYRGLDVKQATALRRELREQGEGEYEYQVVKNSVLKRVCDGGEAEALSEHFIGPTAVAISYGDPAGLAKLLVDYSKQHEVFEIKGGFLDGKPIDASEIQTLATLPSLDQLRGQLAGLMNAPATKLVRLFNEPAAQLARLMKARQDALVEGGEA